MPSHSDRNGVTEGRQDADSSLVKDSSTATLTQSQLSQSGKTGTESHRRSRPSLSKAQRSLSHDTDTDILLQSPSAPHSRPVLANNRIQRDPVGTIQAAVWDWQPPSQQGTNTFFEAPEPESAYLFEPQGELLLHERGDTADTRPDEFSIPDPVISSSSDQRPANPLEALLAEGTTEKSSLRAGTKRKSAPDISSLGSETAKRPALSRAEDRASGSTNAHSGMNSQRTQSVDRRHWPQSHRTGNTHASTTLALPVRKVFPIQIGDKLFRLSGASISSDAPSYFSQFFEEQLRQESSTATDASRVRTLYIDRDPSTFCDISLHLQGYHIEPRDGAHFVKLFADAQFFSLPRLTSQLFSSAIYTTIGSTPFVIPRELFSNSPGNEPNYFTLGFQMFFTTPSDAFPGLSQRSLLRPPSLVPPTVPNRDAKVFADLLRMLKGYDVEVNCEEYRAALLRDARYFHFRGLEQKLLRCRVSYDAVRQVEELEMRLEDIRQSGLSFFGESSGAVEEESEERAVRGEVYYARPYVDDEPRRLILQTGEEVEVMLEAGERVGKVRFWKRTAARMRRLVDVVKEKIGLPGPMDHEGSDGNEQSSSFGLRCEVGREAAVDLDGKRWSPDCEVVAGGLRDRDRGWMAKRSLWRVKIKSRSSDGTIELSLGAVKIEAYSSEWARNETRDFL